MGIFRERRRPGHPTARRSGPLASSAVGLSLIIGCAPGNAEDREVTVVDPSLSGEGGGTGDSRPPVHAPTPEDNLLVEAEPPPFCGDGAANDDEQCDDGNTTGGDGCSANCLVVEQGFTCDTPG